MSETPKIDCEETLRRLLAYLDGELQDREGREVEEHLHRCRSCFSRAEFERRLKAHLAELGSAPVPPAFEARVRSLLRQFSC